MGLGRSLKKKAARLFDFDRNKKKEALERAGLEEQFSPTNFSSVQDVYRTAERQRSQKKVEEKAHRKTSKNKSKKVNNEIYAMLRALNMIPNRSANAISVPAPVAPAAPVPATLPAPATHVPEALAAVPQEVIQNPSMSFSNFQDAVLALTKVYGTDPEARVSKYTDLLMKAKTLQLEAEADTNKTEAVLLKIYIGTLAEVEKNLTEKQKIYDQKWSELNTETELLKARSKECPDPNQQKTFDVLFRLLNDTLGAQDLEKFKHQLQEIRLEVDNCTNAQSKYKHDQYRIEQTATKLIEFGTMEKQCDKKEYTDQLAPHVAALHRLRGASIAMFGDDNYLTGIIAEADAAYDRVLDECMKKEMKNTSHVAQASPLWKAAKYTAITVGVGLAVTGAVMAAPAIGAAGAAAGSALGSAAGTGGAAAGSGGSAIGSAAGTAGAAIGSVGSAIGSAAGTAGAAIGSVGSAIGSAAGTVGSAFGSVAGYGRSGLSAVRNYGSSGLSAVRNISSYWNGPSLGDAENALADAQARLNMAPADPAAQADVQAKYDMVQQLQAAAAQQAEADQQAAAQAAAQASANQTALAPQPGMFGSFMNKARSLKSSITGTSAADLNDAAAMAALKEQDRTRRKQMKAAHAVAHDLKPKKNATSPTKTPVEAGYFSGLYNKTFGAKGGRKLRKRTRRR